MSDVSVNPRRPKSPDFARPDDFDVARFIRLPFQYGRPTSSRPCSRSTRGAWRAAALAAVSGSLEVAATVASRGREGTRPETPLRVVIENGPGFVSSRRRDGRADCSSGLARGGERSCRRPGPLPASGLGAFSQSSPLRATRVPLADIADALGISTADAAEDLGVLACCGPPTPHDYVPVTSRTASCGLRGAAGARSARASLARSAGACRRTRLAGVPASAAHAQASRRRGDTGRLRRGGHSAHRALQPWVARSESSSVARRRREALRQDDVPGRPRRSRGPRRGTVGARADQGAWYLEAYCRAGALRTFRVDRIRPPRRCRARRPSSRDGHRLATAFSIAGLPSARSVRDGRAARKRA